MSETVQGDITSPEYVVVCVDGPNADNQAAAWGAWTAFDNPRIQLAAIIISGTAVDYRPDAPLGSRDDELSRYVQEMHTARMAGLFKRAGSDVPVFIGKPVAETAITTPIPHNAHVSHDDYDIFQDNTGYGRRAIAGNFNDALTHIAGLDNKIHVVVGGPFTEIPFIFENPTIAHKLGHLAAQVGFELSERAIYSLIAFNGETDLHALLKTLLFYPGEIVAVPSDITRAPEATFRGAEELIRLGIHPELGEIFKQHRARAEVRHKEEQIRRETAGLPFREYPALSIHDLQAVMALRQLAGLEKGIFTFKKVEVARAIENILTVSQLHEVQGMPPAVTPEIVEELGYLGCNQTVFGPIKDRFVVSAQDTKLYKKRARRLLQTK